MGEGRQLEGGQGWRPALYYGIRCSAPLESAARGERVSQGALVVAVEAAVEVTGCVTVVVTVCVTVDAGILVVVAVVVPGAVTVRGEAVWVTVIVAVDGVEATRLVVAMSLCRTAGLAVEAGLWTTLRMREMCAPLARIPRSSPTIMHAIAPDAPNATWCGRTDSIYTRYPTSIIWNPPSGDGLPRVTRLTVSRGASCGGRVP
jgi:hypothetical protein